MERFWGSEAELGLWIAISIALYAMVTNLEHMSTGWTGRFGQALKRVKRGRYASWLGEMIHLLYYVGLPYTVIVFRRTGQPAYMGIPPLEGNSLTVGQVALLLLGLAHPVEAWRKLWPALGLTTGALGLAAILCWWYARSLRALLPDIASTVGTQPVPWWIAFREAVYLQVHWAFYRSGLILLTGDFYNGTALGLALIFLEWFLNPAWRTDLRQPFRAEIRLSQLGLTMVTAVLFSITHLLWPGILAHWALVLIYARHIFPAYPSACAGLLSANIQRINE